MPKFHFLKGSLLGFVASVASVAAAQDGESLVAPAIPAVEPSETSDLSGLEATFTEPNVMDTSLAADPALPPCPPPPKKKAPPVFPGPKFLPPTGPYKPLYFDNDFSYKKDPEHEYVLGEELKDMPFEWMDQPFTFSTGGEVRHRYMNEDNRLRPGGPIHSDNNLWRWRHYADLKAGTWFRAYVEGIHSDSFDSEAPDQAIDVNRWDLQNAFFDINFLEDDYGTHSFRYGRQELLFGRQRLASPLDWSNIRRNFEGYRYWHKGEKHRLDLFAVNPLNSATGYRSVAFNDNNFDEANYGVWFAGAYFTYSGIENTTIEPYWFLLDTRDDLAPRPDGERHTIGARMSHLHPVMECGAEIRTWDFDVEGAIQFGEDNNEDVIAGFFTTVVGHTWKQAPWSPRLSGLFYWASGDNSPTDNKNNTFNTLFPLGHAYWGISDNLAGQNLYDYSIQVDVKPTKKTGVATAMHFFDLASSGDKLYNVAGVPVGTPGNGREVGEALDLYGYYAFNPNFDVQVGYSWFWYGAYIDNTAPRGDATQFYVQTSLRY